MAKHDAVPRATHSLSLGERKRLAETLPWQRLASSHLLGVAGAKRSHTLYHRVWGSTRLCHGDSWILFPTPALTLRGGLCASVSPCHAHLSWGCCAARLISRQGSELLRQKDYGSAIKRCSLTHMQMKQEQNEA